MRRARETPGVDVVVGIVVTLVAPGWCWSKAWLFDCGTRASGTSSARPTSAIDLDLSPTAARRWASAPQPCRLAWLLSPIDLILEFIPGPRLRSTITAILVLRPVRRRGR